MPAKPLRRPKNLDPRRMLARFLVRQDARLIDDLVDIRRRRQLSQAAVAEKMGVTQSAIARFESGERDARLSTIRRYAMAVDASVRHDVRCIDEDSSWRDDDSLVSRDLTGLLTWESQQPARPWATTSHG